MKSAIETLEEFIKGSPDSRELKRALSVKLALSGYTYRAVQEMLGVTPGFVSKWKKEFSRRGLEGILLRYQGSKSYLSVEEKKAIIQWIINQSHWDIWELESYILTTYDLAFKSKQSYYQLFQEARISWQKAEATNPKKDLEEVKKNSRDSEFTRREKRRNKIGKARGVLN